MHAPHASWLLIVRLAATLFRFVQVVHDPLMERVGRDGFDAAAHRLLVSTNRIRTAAWSLRSVLPPYRAAR